MQACSQGVGGLAGVELEPDSQARPSHTSRRARIFNTVDIFGRNTLTLGNSFFYFTENDYVRGGTYVFVKKIRDSSPSLQWRQSFN